MQAKARAPHTTLIVRLVSPNHWAINTADVDVQRLSLHAVCSSIPFGARKAEWNRGRRQPQPVLPQLLQSYRYRRLASLNSRSILPLMMHAAIDKMHFEKRTPPNQHCASYLAMMFSHRSTHSAKLDRHDACKQVCKRLHINLALIYQIESHLQSHTHTPHTLAGKSDLD